MQIRGLDLMVFSHPSCVLCLPLSSLINSCLEAGYFPNFLKVTRVTPVFKGDDTTQLGNYRPISALPAISKIFERVINERLVYFLQRQGSIPNGQQAGKKFFKTMCHLAY